MRNEALPNEALLRDMREYAYWKRRRDELVREALAASMPIERIAAVMDISKSAIRRIRGTHG
jgi:hypothetical protein